MGRFACSRSFRHCRPDLLSGLRCSAAPSSSARKAMPRTSAATLSRVSSSSASRAASASPCCSSAAPGARPAVRGGTLWTSSPSSAPTPAASRKAAKNCSAVALMAQVTRRTSPSGVWATTCRERWLGGSATAKIPPAGACVWLPKRAKCDESSMTSKSSASARSTFLRGMEFDVLPPCCTCRQMPKSSCSRATLLPPLCDCSCVRKV
mmetsp:Transcript_12998/g.40998  ORF Transcript_12998/g.40998 Transcript_12998/m.40998 type:complete len:208 (-) Transcript_12998:331-954(-)